uniref:Uncharacterized protein n=1 Tax=Anguilla anguilla TaxID=7936 RepID=A0A0E9WA06_ANGAN
MYYSNNENPSHGVNGVSVIPPLSNMKQAPYPSGFLFLLLFTPGSQSCVGRS